MRHQSVSGKTVLDRFVFLSLAVMFFVSASAVFAGPNTLRETKTYKQPKQTNAKSPIALYKQIMLRIDEIEQRAPQCQTEIFGLREDINQFYSFAVGDLTDPVDKNGKPIVADLQKGNDMYDNC
ncbi:MAG: hypothetical protein PHQ02_07875, partial [Candidatus Riflebacteria bacterium]|nr:hypothetical protein [Candidatus Riflebacteria bacterium]